MLCNQTTNKNKQPSKPNSKKSYGNIKCWICGEMGHAAAYCPTASKQQKLDAYKAKNVQPPKILTEQANKTNEQAHVVVPSKRTQTVDIQQTVGTQPATRNKQRNKSTQEANFITLENCYSQQTTMKCWGIPPFFSHGIGYNFHQFFLPDSGATKWMTPFLYDFIPGSIKKIQNISIRVGDGHRIPVHKSGTIEFLFQHT